VDVHLHVFLTSALDGGKLLASCSGLLNPVDRRLDEPQSEYGRFGEEKNLLFLLEIETSFLEYPSCSLVNMPRFHSGSFLEKRILK
jgi:hypothetical protein